MPATPDVTYTINRPDVWRPYTYVYAITLSNTVTDANLLRDGVPYRYIENIGTSGLVMIRWGNGTDVAVWINQGSSFEGGLFTHAYNNAGGTDAGVVLRGFVGMPGFPGG